VRKIKNDHALYFGPYSSVYSVRSTLRKVNRIFRLRKCRKNQFNNRSRPCLNFQIKACLGPCCNNVSEKEYKKVVKDVVLFLRGKAPELVRKLKQDMKDKALMEQFEEAAAIRDTIFAIEKTLERQVVVSADRRNRDVISCAGLKDKAVVTIFFVRSGNLIGTRHYYFNMGINNTCEILCAFIRQYYEKNAFLPGQILISEKIEDRELIEHDLSLKKGKQVKILVPVRGEKRRIIEMALNNGQKELEKLVSKEADTMSMLKILEELLNMSSFPERIECFDNSNIAGTDPVSAMVVFINGFPNKSKYRKFIIKNVKGQDDYACMTEVLTRRFLKDESDTRFPDLLLVDGGKGQISMAMAVLKELGLENRFQVAGIAKKDMDKGEDQDKIYLPNRSNPVNFGHNQKVLFLLQRLRNEAHRFAIGFQRKRRWKRAEVSILDGIPGIGIKRKQTLLKTYKGISRMRQASVEELASLPGMTFRASEMLAAKFAEIARENKS